MSGVEIRKALRPRKVKTSVVEVRKALRPRKEINYNSTNLDDTVASEDNSSSGDELFSKKAARQKQESSPLIFHTKPDEEDELNEYRLQRQKNMRDRFNVLKTLEFDDDVENLKTVSVSPKTTAKRVPKKRPIKQPSSNQPVKRSSRLQNKSLNTTLDVDSILDTSTFQETSVQEDKDERILQEKLSFVDSEADENIQFLLTLKNDLHIPYEENSDYFNCDMKEIEEVLRSSQMRSEPSKIIKQRIVSMDFYPSEKKLLLLAGDKQGNVALWDLVKDTGIEFKTHAYNVNCVSFSNQDSTKFFSTSLDGTLRRGDINDGELDLVYSSLTDHTPWHHEFGHCLLVAHGNGTVKLLDLRENRSKTTFDCHSKSVRTVQLHPTNENYFLTSSGVGEFGIWDLRNSKSHESEAVILQNFDKALTSAFFSAKGNYVLTTCNDDTIRTFDCSDLQNSIPNCKINHNNHGGRWLSVFKARWLPQREDSFIVGSMMNNPKRMQVYKSSGNLIHQFISENMVTYNPVVVVHPWQPIFVGGNGSGRINVFTPYRSLSEICS